MRWSLILTISSFLYVSLAACPTDVSSAGVILNCGEYFSYDNIKALGENGVHFITEDSGIPGQTTKQASTIIKDSVSYLGKVVQPQQSLSATLVDASFNYDVNAITSFQPEPMFAFNNDTLVIHDYWLLNDQPNFRCSLSVSNDSLFISYVPLPGVVLDWMPSVETTMKIRFGGSTGSIVCCFNAVGNARVPNTMAIVSHNVQFPYTKESVFSDATKQRFVTVPVPPLTTYKYRAHTYPSAMVYLHYYGWMHPRITVTFDSTALAKDSIPFATILSKELKWLATEGICTPSLKTLDWLDSRSSSMAGGWCYWSKQDSSLKLNQSFWFVPESIAPNVWEVITYRGGCGLGTDFALPAKELGSTRIVTSASSVSMVPTIQAGIRHGVLNIVSSKSFDNVAIYNLLGCEVFYEKFVDFVNNISIQMSNNRYIPGNYLVVIRSGNRQIACTMLAFQK